MFLLVFALMTPLGSLASTILLAFGSEGITIYFDYVMAMVIGIFLHVSTSILFETGENHYYNRQKFFTVVIGMATGTQKYASSVVGTAIVCGALVYLWWTAFGSRHRYNAVLTLQIAGDPAAGLATLAEILRRHSRRTLLTNERRYTEAGTDVAYRRLL